MVLHRLASVGYTFGWAYKFDKELPLCANCNIPLFGTMVPPTCRWCMGLTCAGHTLESACAINLRKAYSIKGGP